MADLTISDELAYQQLRIMLKELQSTIRDRTLNHYISSAIRRLEMLERGDNKD